ncbi:MAG: DUF4286 family protein [Phycisphaeraceae bacterium]|nr:DUF4286 family protein [Phycisphaeraceae bacterium]MCW5753105.1 DUF4286 family protein [Phycisphaeraceae bacterium]
MAELHYRVVAIIPNPELADRYAQWLIRGHLQDVCNAGATSAAAVRVRPADPSAPIRIESHYTFPSLAHFDEYERLHAPALRQEGLAAFGPETGIRFERTTGETLCHVLQS